MSDELTDNQRIAQEILNAAVEGIPFKFPAYGFIKADLKAHPELFAIEIWEARDGQLVHVKPISPEEKNVDPNTADH